MLRQCQMNWRAEMSREHKCFKKFLRSLNAEASKESYGYKFQKFMNWLVSEKLVDHKENFEALLEWDSDKITDVLEDYVDYMEARGDRNCGTDLASPELFFQNNRKLWHRELVRGGIKKDKGMPGGELPIEDGEITDVYFGTPDLRKRAIISFLSSLGIRPGALTDPVICHKHLVAIEDCYAVKIYDQSSEGYWGFLIPEARRDIDNYTEERRRLGQIITPETPVLATLPSRWNKKNEFMTDDNLKVILEKLIEGKVKRVKTGNRYDKALVTMFRKRFNTKLKLNNQVNSNVAELVMAHKLPGAQGNYTKPTMEECFAEVKKAIPELTIDPAKRQQAIIDKKNQEITEMGKKEAENEGLREMLKAMRSEKGITPKESLKNFILDIIKDEKI